MFKYQMKKCFFLIQVEFGNGLQNISLSIGALKILFRLLQSVNSKQKFIFFQKDAKKEIFAVSEKRAVRY